MTSLNLDQEKVERLIEIMNFQSKLNNEIRLILDSNEWRIPQGDTGTQIRYEDVSTTKG